MSLGLILESSKRFSILFQASLHLDEARPVEGEQSLQLVDRSGNPVIGKNGLPATLPGASKWLSVSPSGLP